MRILFFSVLSLSLLEQLAVHFAREGNDVINLAGKRARGHSLPGVRRIIMNFDEGGNAADYVEAWKQALKNGVFGLKALRNLATSWQPDLIFCRSGQGASFFVRDAFPGAFLSSFAADAREPGIAAELDARLFLQSNLRFAPDNKAIERLPPLLRGAIELEPVCIDTDYFQPGKGKPFSCWKFNAEGCRVTGLVLTGNSEAGLAAWSKIIAEVLAKNSKLALALLVDKGASSGRLIEAMGSLPQAISSRVFITDHLESASWRNLCASAPLVFTAACQKKYALECVAAGGTAWATKQAGLSAVPGLRLLDGRQALKKQLAEIGLLEPDAQAIAAIMQKYGRDTVIPGFIARIMTAYEKDH